MDRKVCAGAHPTGEFNEILDAEAYAVLYGIRSAFALPSARFDNNLWVFTDNKTVVNTLSVDPSSKSSQRVFDEIIGANKIWKCRRRLPHTTK